MPLFMDRHDLADVTAEDVARDHAADLAIQAEYGVNYLTYWFDYERQVTFCLVDSPDAETAEKVHEVAHGGVASVIIPVDQHAVESFLGKLQDPPAPGDIVTESAFRTILFTDIEGSTAMTQELGDTEAMIVVRSHDQIVRTALADLDGREVKHTGDGIMASFASVAKGVECAMAILRAVANHNETAGRPFAVRIGLNAGEPVAEGGDLFGAAVQLARRICDRASASEILASSGVRQLAIGKGFQFLDRGQVSLKGFPEPVHIVEVLWRA